MRPRRTRKTEAIADRAETARHGGPGDEPTTATPTEPSDRGPKRDGEDALSRITCGPAVTLALRHADPDLASVCVRDVEARRSEIQAVTRQRGRSPDPSIEEAAQSRVSATTAKFGPDVDKPRTAELMKGLRIVSRRNARRQP